MGYSESNKNFYNALKCHQTTMHSNEMRTHLCRKHLELKNYQPDSTPSKRNSLALMDINEKEPRYGTPKTCKSIEKRKFCTPTITEDYIHQYILKNQQRNLFLDSHSITFKGQ